MNTRIKELAEQADKLASAENKYYGLIEYSEKFAELIVRECVLLLDSMADPEKDSDRYIWALHNASHHIRQHFGIEV